MIDLRSDTVTKPTEEMRKAAYEAEVGDDVYGEDPTILKLEEIAADLLGKESALFVTSGTQGNQVAVLTHCRSGQEIILESESHIFYYETGAVAAFAGVQTRTIAGIRGAMDPSAVQYAIRDEDQHFPETGLICLENTHNRAGGAVVPISNMKEIYYIAVENNIPVHVDGARLFNSAAAVDKPVQKFTQYCDTVQICLSKGLGAPIGSILAGSREFIMRARKWRKRLGGGLRQAGVIAAPGLIAITKMRDRLIEDHENAKYLSDGLQQINGLQIVNKVETNIIVADVKDLNISSSQFVEKLKENGVLAVAFGPSSVRFVTHYDVSRDDITNALSAINKAAHS
ncbi:low-specificity L-threonine aldolase [Bacillus sp. FJAT-29790]|uniref:low-specificity L-threonine aldolase n=1 Tax=Bacillus sp. FJAT-29790 TaxID=1895002 RepID=UPI001C24BB35|nr:low-specificity L-threonine aldolase [Bacillus sp. FJAT-29790]MBU8877933.1 low-specificity L-threonine aldolase [Bacillus sp. FJAT-29790]